MKVRILLLTLGIFLLLSGTLCFAQEIPVWNGSQAVIDTDYSVNGDTYYIATPLGFAWVLNQVENNNTFLAKTIRIVNNLDMSSAYLPLSTKTFKGTIYGNGYYITGLRCNSNFVGLFYNNSGAILNLNVILDQDLIVTNTTGIIAKYNYGVIQNYFVEGNGVSTNLSGICKTNFGTIAYSGVNDILIKDYTSDIGAIANQNSTNSTKTGVINNCYATNINFLFSELHYVGGIVGLNNAIISNCYAVSYFYGTIDESSYIYMGGLVGINNVALTNCYYNAYTDDYDICDVGLGASDDFTYFMTLNTMKSNTLVTYLNTGQASTAWYIGSSYPVLAPIPIWDGPLATENNDYTVNEDTYTILTPLGLAWLANQVNNGNDFSGKTIELQKNGYYNLSDAAWTPIGNSTSPFNGIFNGESATISGLINNSDASFALFGYLSENAIVKNININIDKNIHSRQNLALIAYLNKGIIENIKVYQDPTNNYALSAATYNYIAGIANVNQGTIEQCSLENVRFSGNENYIGGIATENIINNNNTNPTGIISNCYTYNIYVDLFNQYISLVGGITASNNNIIKNSYATIGFNRELLATDTNIGAIAGNNNGTITNTYYKSLTNLLGIANDATSTSYVKSNDEMQNINFVVLLNENATKENWKAGVTIPYPQFSDKSIISIEKAFDVNQTETINRTLLEESRGKLIFKKANNETVLNGASVLQNIILTPCMENKADYILLKSYIINGKRYAPETTSITVDSISTILTGTVENTYQTTLGTYIDEHKNISNSIYTSESWNIFNTALVEAQSIYETVGVNLDTNIYRDNLETSVANLVTKACTLTSYLDVTDTPTTETLNAGTYVTKTAGTIEGYNFVNWTDASNGIILSTNSSYNFYIFNNMAIKANYALDTKVAVTFTDQFGKFLETQNVDINSSVTPPSNVSRPGYTFAYWLYNGVQYTSGNITIGTTDASIVAYYTANPTTYTLTLTGGTVSTGKTTGYLYSEVAIVTADAPAENMKFAYWKDVTTDSIISYNTTYRFAMSGNTSLEAIFVNIDTVIIKIPLINLSDPAILDTVNGKISFVATLDLETLNSLDTNGNRRYTPLQYGIILYNGIAMPLDLFTANAIVKSVTKTNASGQFSLTKVNVASGNTWSARSYLIYQDSTGTILTTYSPNTVIGTLP